MKFKEILKIIKSSLIDSNFFTYKIFNKKGANTLEYKPYNHKFSEKLAFIVQGPIVEADDFTLETLKIYRKNFEKSIIILSSTSEVNMKIMKELKEINVEFIKCEVPEFGGIANINFQISTTSKGMQVAKESGADYVIKTRTDQRISNPGLDHYLLNLINIFPLDDEVKIQNKRLVACSLNTFKMRPYGISDMFMFGDINDMILYWDTEHDKKKLTDLKYKDHEKPTWREHAESELAEVRFCINFLRKIGCNTPFTYRNSFKLIAKHFVIIDAHSIELFWNKYTLNENRYSYFGARPEISFNDWLMLYLNQNELSFNELLMDKKINPN